MSACTSKVIVALDYSNEQDALALVEQLSPSDCRLKVGKELFVQVGPSLVDRLVALDFDVFLDLKFHDIPNTVAKAVCAAADRGVWMTNVHAAGGRRMMNAAKTSLQQRASNMLLMGVTVLTSMDDADLRESGICGSGVAEQVQRLASLTQESGLDGVVCSAHESEVLKQQCGGDFVLVTPGIRPAESSMDDQRRVMTPLDAVSKGSDYLVIGRAITRAASPVLALQQINQSLQISANDGPLK